MSLYYLILWNQVDILQKHFKKDHVHMRLWTRFYGMSYEVLSSCINPSKTNPEYAWAGVYGQCVLYQNQIAFNVFN